MESDVDGVGVKETLLYIHRFLARLYVSSPVTISSCFKINENFKLELPRPKASVVNGPLDI